MFFDRMLSRSGVAQEIWQKQVVSDRQKSRCWQEIMSFALLTTASKEERSSTGRERMNRNVGAAEMYVCKEQQVTSLIFDDIFSLAPALWNVRCFISVIVLYPPSC